MNSMAGSGQNNTAQSEVHITKSYFYTILPSSATYFYELCLGRVESSIH